MARAVVVQKPKDRSGNKVKTGCATCRIRRIKCDEDKPFCRRCVSTGRKCDGYPSLFRLCKNEVLDFTPTNGVGGVKQSQDSEKVTQHEIELLSRYLSTKTIFNVKLDCSKEARQILQGSLTDPPIRHAITSLRALRQDFETLDENSVSDKHQSLTYIYGIQQYSMALEGLVSKLSTPDARSLKSALLCCHIFISIEQVQQNYGVMVQHIIRGLKIMHEYRARPYLDSENRLIVAHYNDLPLLDVFVIELFAAPCKFSEPPASAETSGDTSSISSATSCQSPITSNGLRTLAPDIRTRLTRIASSTIEFLDKVTRIQSIETALAVRAEKVGLLNYLEAWLNDLDYFYIASTSLGPEPIATSFLRLFHLILKMIILGALDCPSDLNIKIHSAIDQLQRVADGLGERLKDYKFNNGDHDNAK